jgi:hypothetical protein
MNPSIRRSLGLIGLFVLVGSLGAQYPPPPNPYYPVGYGSGFGPGNTLNGQANVIDATGKLFIDQEQARITREQANQAKIDTKRKTFDEMMYEKANTPTFTEDQEKVDMMIVRRIINKPLEAEVTSGYAQNILLPYLDKLLRVGIQGPTIPLDQAMLSQINVTSGSANAGNIGNIGLLKNGGKLDWPLGLRGPTQKKLDPLFPKLVASAAKGDLDADLYFKVNKGVTALQDELTQKFRKEQIDGGLYLEGKRFMESLDSSMKMLRSPTASKFLTGAYRAEGRTVPELVYNMTSKGLRFAPATPGDNAPYFGLQSALVGFAAGAESNHGFRATYDPFVQPPKKSFQNLPP